LAARNGPCWAWQAAANRTAPTKAERAVDLAHLRRGLAHAAKHGITSIVNMDGNIYTLDLLDELRSAGELTARVRVPFHYVPEMKPEDLQTALDHARALVG
jgi:predicted amidohydrolase YtcJ